MKSATQSKSQETGVRTSIPTSSPMRVFLEPVGAGAPIECTLIGIDRGQIHLNSAKWLESGTKAVLTIDRIKVSGEIDYCNRKNNDYRTCFSVGSGRSAPRFPIDEPGSLTVLGDEGTHSSPCRLTDLSRSGLGLNTSDEVKVGAMICVQTSSMLAVGEVRHQHRTPQGTVHIGIEVTDVLCNENTRQKRKGLRKRIAEFILGYPIGMI